MQLVGAAFGHHVHLRAGRAAGVCVGAGGGHAKLFHRVERGAQHAGEGIALHLAVVVEAIERDVALVRARAGYGATATVRVLVDVMTQVEHAWLQAQQVRNVAALNGQGFNGGIVDGVAERCVCGVERSGASADVHRGGHGIHAHGEVDGCRLVDQQLGMRRLGGEPAVCYGDGVVAGRDLREKVLPLVIGRVVKMEALAWLIQRDSCAGQHGTGWIRDRAADGGRGNLRPPN